MAGRVLLVRTVAHPDISNELSHTNKPLLKGPLVLSTEGTCPMSALRLFTFSQTRRVILSISDTDSSEAKGTFVDTSHCVRSLVASNNTDVKRYAESKKDGRIVLACSTSKRTMMKHATMRFRAAATTDTVVLAPDNATAISWPKCKTSNRVAVT